MFNPIDNLKLKEVENSENKTIGEIAQKLSNLMSNKYFFYFFSSHYHSPQLDIHRVDDLNSFLYKFKGVFRDMSSYLKKDKDFINLFLELLNFLVKEKEFYEAVKLLDETFGFNFLHYEWIQEIYKKAMDSEEYFQAYYIIKLIENRIKLLMITFPNDSPQELLEKEYRECLGILLNNFLDDTSAITESELFEKTKTLPKILAILKNDEILGFNILKSRDYTPYFMDIILYDFIKRIVDLTWTFRGEIYDIQFDSENLPDIYYLYNISTNTSKYLTLPENKMVHISRVAEYLELKLKDIEFIFIEDKKQDVES